jgi:hypothetical protein
MNKGDLDSQFNYVGGTFIPVNGTKESLKLGDISASDDFIFSTVQFWTNGGANKRVTVNEFVDVKANYVYWPADCGQVGEVAGWYLEDDTNAKYPQNDVSIPFGSAFIVARDGAETSATVNFAGEVSSSSSAIGDFSTQFNYVGTGCPRSVRLGELIASDDFIFSTIQFWTNAGANKRVSVNEFENVKANYVYWPADCGQVGGVAGWYLEDDTNAKYPQNDVIIPAGGGFVVARDGAETNVKISIPAAIP